MKKLISVLLCMCLLLSFGLFALGSGESETKDQGKSSTDKAEGTSDELDNYKLEILSCRLAKDYEGKDVVIVKYKFTNNDDDKASFMTAFDDGAFQNGVGLNSAVVLEDSANFNYDDQMKEIQKGATIELEIAYELNDTSTDVVVEVSKLFSLNEDKITKTFSIK